MDEDEAMPRSFASRPVYLGLGLLLWASCLAFVDFGMRTPLLKSDAAIYWRQSFGLARPFDSWWVPGYPAAIALLRSLTLGALSPGAVMALLSGASYLLGVDALARLLEELGVERRSPYILLYLAFPFVGVSYAAYPIADSMAIAWLFLAYLAYVRRRWGAFALWAALALITHKAMWFFVPPLMLAAFVGDARSRLVVPLAAVPLLAWMAGGAVYHHDPLWFARWSVTHLVVSKGSLPVLDGLLGSLTERSPVKIVKGAVAVSTVLTALVLLALNLRGRFWPGVTAALGVALIGVAMNRYEIWAVVRFSRVLVVPLAYALSNPGTSTWARPVLAPAPFGAAWSLCLVSNLMFLYYIYIY